MKQSSNRTDLIMEGEFCHLLSGLMLPIVRLKCTENVISPSPHSSEEDRLQELMYPVIILRGNQMSENITRCNRNPESRDLKVLCACFLHVWNFI